MRFQTNSWRLCAALVAAGLLAASADSASADPLKCQRGIAKESQKFLAKKSQILSKCEQDIAKGKLPVSTDCQVANAAAIGSASDKMEEKVVKSCEGETPTTLGYPATCPDLENQGCDAISLATPAGMGDCLACLDGFATDQLYGVIGGGFLDPAGDAEIAFCQRTIAAEGQKFFKTKTKELQKCWDARLKGKHTDVCPNPSADPKSASGKAAAKIAKAEAKLREKVCTACGGEDEACGGLTGGQPNDVTPAEFGFPASCPSVTVPGGQECGLAIDGTQDALDCMVCLSDFKADCATAAGVAQLVSYPAVCDPVIQPACSSATISVDVNFTPPVQDVAGVTVNVNYPGQKLQLGTVTQTNPQAGIFQFTDLDTPPADGFNNKLNAGLVAVPGDIPPGDFLDGEFDCRDGAPGPDISEFACTADASTLEGESIPATCTVSLNVVP